MRPGFNTWKGFLGFRPDKKRICTGDRKDREDLVGTRVRSLPGRWRCGLGSILGKGSLGFGRTKRGFAQEIAKIAKTWLAQGCCHCRTGGDAGWVQYLESVPWVSAGQKEDLHRRSQRSRRPGWHRGAVIAGPVEMRAGFNTWKVFLGCRPDKKRICTGDRKDREDLVSTGALSLPDRWRCGLGSILGKGSLGFGRTKRGFAQEIAKIAKAWLAQGCCHCRTGGDAGWVQYLERVPWVSAGQKEDLHRRSQRSRRPGWHRGAVIAGPVEMRAGFNTWKGFLGFRPDKKRICTGDRKDREDLVGTGALSLPDRWRCGLGSILGKGSLGFGRTKRGFAQEIAKIAKTWLAQGRCHRRTDGDAVWVQ